MANIKSAKKRILVTQTKALRNKMTKSAVKTAVKKVDAAIAANDKELAKAELLKATSAIDKAASKGIYHKNTGFQKNQPFEPCCQQNGVSNEHCKNRRRQNDCSQAVLTDSVFIRRMPSVKKNEVFLNGRNANYSAGIVKTEADILK